MQRLNRSKALGIACVVVFIWFLIFTDSGSSASNFRANTESAIAHKRAREKELPLRGQLSDEDLTRKTNEELQGIINSHSKEKLSYDASGNPTRQRQNTLDTSGHSEQLQQPHKENADSQDPKTKSAVQEKEHKISEPNVKSDQAEKALKATSAHDADDLPRESEPSIAQQELEEYLKSPVVIFSKSYCPHSKKAKHLLLEVYDIKPKPVVVELDLLTKPLVEDASDDGHGSHTSKPLGRALQDLLGQMTGRRTVPNIVVGGKHSIGGNDNIWALHESRTLIEEIQHFGGRKVISVDLRESED